MMDSYGIKSQLLKWSKYYDGPRKVDLVSIYLFIVGITYTLDVDLVGRVAVAELLMIPALFVLIRPILNAFSSRLFSVVISVSIISILATAISDLVINEVGFDRFIRGEARYAFFLIHLFFWVGILYKDSRLFRCFIYGLIPGAIFSLFRITEYDSSSIQAGLTGYEYWLFKVTPLVRNVIFGLSLLLYWRSKRFVSIMFFIAALIIAYYSSRTQAAALLITGLIVLVLSLRKNERQIIISRRVMVSIVFAFFMSVGLVYSLYLYSAPKGYLGENQRGKYAVQTNTVFGVTPWGILLAGRAESFAALKAASEKPIWGYGSWSIPSNTMIDTYHLLGVDMPAYTKTKIGFGEDAGHSVIFGAWAANGIFATILWIVVLYCVCRLFVLGIEIESAYTPYLIILSLSSLFTLLFNPLNLGARSALGLAVAFAFYLIEKRKNLERINLNKGQKRLR